MANIAITNYCNLSCPYCFANEFILENKEEISISQLNTILEFLKKAPPPRIGIIGGEPTLHPKIDVVISTIKEFVKTYNGKIALFTNGIQLNKIFSLIDNTTDILINLNEPEVIGDYNWKKIQQNLTYLAMIDKIRYVKFGINLYLDIKNLEYIFVTAKQFKQNTIRCSCVAPTCQYKNISKYDYYNRMKPIFLQFCNLAKQYNIQLALDCNHIPKCYFTDEEYNTIKGVILNDTSICVPVVDITPSFYGSSCFGSYDLIDLHQFENLLEAIKYFKEQKMNVLMEKNDAYPCTNCDRFQEKKCQGGCLAFAKHKID